MSLSSAPLSHKIPSLPSPTRQACYFSTGCLAGLASLPPAFYPSLPSPHLALPTILRAGTRFYIFDMTRHILSPLSLPVPISGALGGAAGGFSEVLLQNLIQYKRFPDTKALGSQSLKLFFCFGTFTFLSTRFSGEVPPKPFVYCWGMGAVAGAVGSAVVGALEGSRGKGLWLGVVPRGALTIGTVISVQVTSCAALLSSIED